MAHRYDAAKRVEAKDGNMHCSRVHFNDGHGAVLEQASLLLKELLFLRLKLQGLKLNQIYSKAFFLST